MLNSGVNKTGYIETCSFKCVRQSKGEAAQCSTTACDVDRSTGGGGLIPRKKNPGGFSSFGGQHLYLVFSTMAMHIYIFSTSLLSVLSFSTFSLFSIVSLSGFIRFGHMIRRRQTRLYGQSCCYIDPDGPKNICMSCYTCKSTQSYMDSDQLGAIGVLGLFHRIN